MRLLPGIFILLVAAGSPLAAAEEDRDPAWAEAWKAGPLSAEETRGFMKELAQYVFAHHFKKAEGSPQRGMSYEYFHVPRAGQPDQFVQGEALDTMHDGAWFAIAMATAFRATGDPLYREILTQWQLPFYLKMLNHADELFSAEHDDARPGAAPDWSAHPEWLLQAREKGFVPYWWDDGNSLSIEMLASKTGDTRLNFPGHDNFAGKPNPEHRLSGYSFGSSNHMAQDLALLLEESWLLLHESKAPGDVELTRQIAEAAQRLEECRTRHGAPNIPAVRAALSLASGDQTMRRNLTEETWKSVEGARSDYRRGFFEFKPGEVVNVPAFADNQEYAYFIGLARSGTLLEPLAFHLAYDAFTLPKLYATYSDDAPVPPGINVFDLHPYRFVDGHPTDYRSERKGPGKRPRPIGSRFGPQNMVVAGWGLQALRAYPGLWEKAQSQIKAINFFPEAKPAEVQAALERELGGGLRTWEAIFRHYGYIPTGIGAGNSPSGFPWQELSDTGGYAHLITAGAQWIFLLEGKKDWETLHVPPIDAAK